MSAEEETLIKEEEKEDASIQKDEGASPIGGAKFLLITNGNINFVFYGLNSIIVTFYNQTLHFSEPLSSLLTNLAFAVTYAFGLVGGYLADSRLGHFKNQLVGIIIIFFGVLLMTLSQFLSKLEAPMNTEWIVFTGIIMFVCANGMIKPSSSTFLGDQFNSNEEKLRSQYFSWYYFSVQVGSVISSVALPIILDNYSALLCFTILLGMAGIMVPIYFVPSPLYRKKPAANTGILVLFFGIIWAGLWNPRLANELHWLDKAKIKYDSRDVEDVKIAVRTLKIFVPLPFFWAIFFQIYSLWVFLARDMNRKIGSWTVPANLVVVLNPIFDIILIPFFTKLVYPKLEACGWPLTPLKRIAAGHIFCAGALLVSGFVQVGVDKEIGSLTIWWIVPQFVLISCAEILLSVTTFEFAYTQAPKNMKGMIAALYLVTIALGNAVTALLALIKLKRSILYFILTGLTLVVLGLFYLVARNYTYVQDEAEVSVSTNQSSEDLGLEHRSADA